MNQVAADASPLTSPPALQPQDRADSRRVLRGGDGREGTRQFQHQEAKTQRRNQKELDAPTFHSALRISLRLRVEFLLPFVTLPT